MSVDVQSFIEHHGVKGMRWGVRKRSSTSEGGAGPTRRRKSRTVYSKSPSNLTTAQLQKRIQRLEMEKRYNELNKRDVTQGEKIATDILTNVGKQVVTNVGTKIGTNLALKGVGKVLERQFGSNIAEVALQGVKKKKDKD